MERASHWNQVYSTAASDAVSWFQEHPATSLRLLEEAGLAPAS